METKQTKQEENIVNYGVIDNVEAREDSFKDRLKECKKLFEEQPQNVYLCSDARIIDYRSFIDDDEEEKIALHLNDKLVQSYKDNKRDLVNTLFDFENNIIRILCENSKLRPLREYLNNSMVLSCALIGAKVSFYQIHREGGKIHTLTNGREYIADNSFFESVILKIKVDDKAIEAATKYAVMIAK